jgi:hypothetical protein
MRHREILPIASLLLPAISTARFSVTRLDRDIAAIQTVEALRLYAAKNGGKLPARLEDITEVPVPIDPVNGRLFDYKLEGRSATLEGKAPAGRTPENAGLRYIVTMADANVATSSAQRPPMPSARGTQNQWWTVKTQGLFSDLAKEVTGLVTTNPILEYGAHRRQAHSVQNLKRLGLALLNYESAQKHFPPPANHDNNGKPLLSWRVHILPYLDQSDLYRQFNLDEPWDSEHNKKLIAEMPAVYRVPTLPPLPEHTTTYLVPFGNGTIFHDDKGTPVKEIRDGLSKTILVVEADADQAVIWTKPGDWPFDPSRPMRGLGKLRRDAILVTFGDGRVSHLTLERSQLILPGAFTRSGGEKFSE